MPMLMSLAMSVSSYNNHSVFDGCVVEEAEIPVKRFIPLILILASLATDTGAVTLVDGNEGSSASTVDDLFNVVTDTADLAFGVNDVQHVRADEVYGDPLVHCPTNEVKGMQVDVVGLIVRVIWIQDFALLKKSGADMIDILPASIVNEERGAFGQLRLAVNGGKLRAVYARLG